MALNQSISATCRLYGQMRFQFPRFELLDSRRRHKASTGGAGSAGVNQEWLAILPHIVSNSVTLPLLPRLRDPLL
jgi:hypothetical protein